MAELERRNASYASAVPHAIHGLFSGFYAAATILRVARKELDPSVELEAGSLEAFYKQLSHVEQSLSGRSSDVTGGIASPYFVVVVEGLDGTGKSTLVESLVQQLPSPYVGRACATPPQSMAAIRPVFDKRGGAVARAFYAVGNYVLQFEMEKECEENPSASMVFVVDRWYSSTCAYSIAWENTHGGPESIDELDSRFFEWPKDLGPPQLMILLEVDDRIRRQRVINRAARPSFNPWDDRLSQDVDLGKRIMRAHERSIGPLDQGAYRCRSNQGRNGARCVNGSEGTRDETF